MRIGTTGRFFILVAIYIVAGIHSFAQSGPKCGFDKTIQAVKKQYPAFADVYEQARNSSVSYKTTLLTDTPVIPVVFHVVLTRPQMALIGDTSGIRQRIESQIEVLNRDFSATNADINKVPGNFKNLVGNTGIRFALAHTAPDGSPSPGFEIITTNKNGFNLDREYGSGFGFSGAKYNAGGGADAWDVESYMNIWVVNLLEENAATNILGLAIPAYLAVDEYGLNKVETGIVLNFSTLGVRKNLLDFFPRGSDQGRTLVHEMGHMLELLHIWGDDDGKCPFNGGADDGIEDTPPQSYASSGCSVYPRFDACSRTGDGIMFMNYMDYSSDTCAYMFTQGQAAKMKHALQPGSAAYGLTQQPWLVQYPDVAKTPFVSDFVVYPNPARDVLNVMFRNQAQGLRSIQLIDIMGRLIATKEYETASLFYTFSTVNMYAGLYFVVLEFDKGREVRKVIIR